MQRLLLENEKEHRSIGMISSVILHLILLLILLINFWRFSPPDPSQKGVLVSFGQPLELEQESSQNMDTERQDEQESKQTSRSSEPSPSTPTPPIPEKPKVIAQKSPVVLEEKPEKPIVPQKTEAQKKAEAEALKKKQEEEDARREAEDKAEKQRALEAQKKKFGSALSGKKNEETTTGDPEASALEKLSEGSGLVGAGLSNRGVVSEPVISENSQKSGIVIVEICVNENGDVMEAKYRQKGSTTTDLQLIRVAERAAKKYKFTVSNVPKQCGTVTISFVVK